MDTKSCTKCKEAHPVSNFHKCKQAKDGFDYYCKPCKRLEASKHRLWSLYGLRLSDFRRMWDQCGGRCEICNAEMTNTLLDDKPRDRSTQAHIDHCHETGVVRGLLCSSCNIGLGNFKDDVSRLQSAANYLEKPTTDFSANPETDKQRQLREMENAMRLLGYSKDSHGRFHEEGLKRKSRRDRVQMIRARISSNNNALRPAA